MDGNRRRAGGLEREFLGRPREIEDYTGGGNGSVYGKFGLLGSCGDICAKVDATVAALGVIGAVGAGAKALWKAAKDGIKRRGRKLLDKFGQGGNGKKTPDGGNSGGPKNNGGSGSGNSDGPTAGGDPFESVRDNVSRQRQNRHVKGTKEWERKKGGYFNSLEDAQEVLDAAKGGRAKVVGSDNHGNPIVEFDGVTGYNNNPGAGYVDQPTNKFKIKGTKSPSVVPVSPTEGD